MHTDTYEEQCGVQKFRCLTHPDTHSQAHTCIHKLTHMRTQRHTHTHEYMRTYMLAHTWVQMYACMCKFVWNQTCDAQNTFRRRHSRLTTHLPKTETLKTLGKIRNEIAGFHLREKWQEVCTCVCLHERVCANVSVHLCLFFCLSICLSVSLSICLSVYLFVCLPVHLCHGAFVVCLYMEYLLFHRILLICIDIHSYICTHTHTHTLSLYTHIYVFRHTS